MTVDDIGSKPLANHAELACGPQDAAPVPHGLGHRNWIESEHRQARALSDGRGELDYPPLATEPLNVPNGGGTLAPDKTVDDNEKSATDRAVVSWSLWPHGSKCHGIFKVGVYARRPSLAPS
jgi:hypothetical protein